MSRPLLAVLACLLLSSCATESAATAPPTVDLGQVASLARARMNEVASATYRTETTFGSQADRMINTDVTGVWRHDAAGSWSTAHVLRTKPKSYPVVDAVLVPGSLYWRSAGSSTWKVAPESEPEAYYSPLGGFALNSGFGAELDYLEPRAATLKASGPDRVDGVDTTRYDLEVDPAKFAALVANPFRRKLHDELVGLNRPVVARVWVDATGLPVKAAFELPFDERRGTTTWFENWGRPVVVETPAL
ncbi:hypothetical protein ACFFQW_42330 [Umezawaea endophytica]|uniref:Outer membrane lipoprotein-sorting protein n=1 Tax=Umezawaea endophytica TaxID=1654476 RepID=A0A9X2VP06_9PSEU|nr:hypothetical protein [Umezawaea endophytica]MCS7480216.1 hypothetical protein [Umezawaea endophytica]